MVLFKLCVPLLRICKTVPLRVLVLAVSEMIWWRDIVYMLVDLSTGLSQVSGLIKCGYPSVNRQQPAIVSS